MRIPAGLLFATATLAPAGLLVVGGLWAPWLLVPALVGLTLVAFALDEGVPPPPAGHRPDALARGLPIVLAAVHFAVLAVGIGCLGAAMGDGDPMGLVAFAGFGLWLGTVSTANAHELIHRSARLPRALGRWVFISLLFGHHASAHPLVHHVHVATPRDPNSAPRGRGFYRFFVDAWAGSFAAGLAAEEARRIKAGRGVLAHPYLVYIAGALVALGLSATLGGARAVAAHLALALFAQAQLLLSDYVQHYGLSRATDPATGRPEPVGVQHSWNAPHWFTALMTMNAARHSDHHVDPRRDYLGLRDGAALGAPLLPHSIPMMAVLALIPPLYKRIMARELAALAARQPGAAHPDPLAVATE